MSPVAIGIGLLACALYLAWYIGWRDLQLAGRTRGMSREAKRNLARAMAARRARFPLYGWPFRSARMLACAELSVQAGEYVDALSLGRLMLSRERDPRGVAAGRMVVSRALDGLWRFAEADSEADAGLELLEQTGFPSGRLILERAEALRRRCAEVEAKALLRGALIRTDVEPHLREAIALHYMLVCQSMRLHSEALDYGRGVSGKSFGGPVGPPLAKAVCVLYAHFADFDRARELCHAIEDPVVRVSAEAHLLTMEGAHEEALLSARAALALAKTASDDEFHYTATLALLRLGRTEEALRAAMSRLEQAEPLGTHDTRVHRAIWLTTASQICALQEDWLAAEGYLAAACGIPRTSAFLHGVAASAHASALSALERTEEAMVAYRDAEQTLRSLPEDKRFAGQTDALLGRAACAMGDFGQAEALLAAALERGIDHTHTPAVLYHLGLTFEAQGRTGDATDAFRRAAEGGYVDHYALLARRKL